jgi:hypothetical protein
LKLIGCENFGSRVLEFLVKPTPKGGLDENSGGLKICALLMPHKKKCSPRYFLFLSSLGLKILDVK